MDILKITVAGALIVACGGAAGAAESVAEQLREVQTRVFFSDQTALMGVRIEDPAGDEDKRRWAFQFWDPNYKNEERVIVVAKGAVFGDETGQVAPFDNRELRALEPGDVGLALGWLREKASGICTAAGKPVPEGFRYILSAPLRATGTPAQPEWRVTGFGPGGAPVGYFVLRATDGEVVSAAWGKEAAALVMADERQAKGGVEKFGDDVGQAFRDFGGGLRDLFGGKKDEPKKGDAEAVKE